MNLDGGSSAGLTNPLTENLDANSNKIINLADGTNAGDAVNFSQLGSGSIHTLQEAYDISVQNQIVTDATRNEFVVQGGVADGNVALAVANTAGVQKVTIDGGGDVSLTGDLVIKDSGGSPYFEIIPSGILSGIRAYNNQILNVGDPSSPQDAATANYVDNQIALIPAPDLSDLVSKTTLIPQSIASTLTTNGTVVMNTGALQIQGSTVQIQNSGSCQIQPTGILSLKEFSTTGNITMGGTAQIKNLAPGVALTDAVNLSQIPAPVSLVALEAKTQNIDLTTSSGNTDITGTITLNNELTIPVVTSRNTNNYIVGDGGTGLTGDGEYNMVFGNGLAGNALTTGDRNVIVGALAGELLDTGEKNVLIGTNTGDLLTSGGFNTIVGHGAGASGSTPLSTGEDNLLLGTFSNIDDNTNENIAIGARATASGGLSIALGARSISTQAQQLMIGGPNSAWGINSVVPGYITCDLGSSSNTFQNLHISGQAFVGGESTVPVVTSRAAAPSNTYVIGDAVSGASMLATATNNIIFGNGSALLAENARDNVIIGHDVAPVIISGGNNVIIGDSAGSTMTGGNNTVIGRMADISDSSSSNVAIGLSAKAAGGRATAVGEQAQALAEGGVALGLAAQVLATHDHSVALGQSAVTTSANQLMIGSVTASAAITEIVPGIATCDLGSTANKFKDIYLSGKVETPSILADDIQITGTNTLTIDSALLLVNTVLFASDFVKYTGVSYLNPPGDNSLSAVGYVKQEIAAISSYVEYYWNSNTTYSTPNPGIDTFGPVWASPSPLAQAGLSTSDWTFTAQTAELQYTGTTTRIFSINANWSWQMGLTSPSEDVQINLAINGTPQAKLQTYTRLNDTANNYPRNAGMCGFISLAPNDTIRMYAKVVTDAIQTHYYRNFNFTVRNI